MRRMQMLLCAMALPAIFLLVGCGGGGSQAGKQRPAHHSHGAKLALYPEGDSGVRGTSTFEDVSKGVLVKLQLRNLPEPDTLYLAHIHPGTCAQGEEGEGRALEHGEHGEHAEQGKGHEHGGEIEYPLSQVKSNSEGGGSSTTTLHHTSVEKLFSGGPKHVNVHEAGTGDPPILACADLKGALSPAKKKQGEREGARQAQTTVPEPTASTHSSKSASGSTSGEQQAAQSEADCRLVLYVANKNMSPKEAEAFSKLLTEMIGSMESLSWPEGTLRNTALDHLAVPRYRECKHIE
jgi:hypothetical protein